MTISYCKAFMLIILFFIGVSAFTESNQFFVLYPALLCTMLPTSLISYDEKSKWNNYCDIFPYTRAQVVTEKYILALLSLLFVTVLSAFAQGYRLTAAGSFVWKDFVLLLAPMLLVGLIGPAFLLPFIFRFGSEKGRIAYYVVVILTLVAGSVGGRVGDTVLFTEAGISPVLIAGGIGVVLLFVSWLISVSLYAKREL